MKKTAYPWIGPIEDEMGSMSKSFFDSAESAYTGYDSLVPEKALHENVGPTTGYSESRISPVDGDGEGVFLADDDDLSDCNIDIYSESDKKLASFSCNIAEKIQEKVNGLQVYSSLSKNSGLLFKYDKPQDLLFHMGTVSFPIDIIFINKDCMIKKICKNILPNTLGTYGCSDSKFVLEVNGGLAEEFGLDSGDLVKINYSNNYITKSASIKEYKMSPDIVHVYNLDGIINKNPNIRVSKILEYNEDNITLRYDNEVFSPGESRIINASDLEKNKNYLFSKTASGMGEFLENSKDMYLIYNDIKKFSKYEDNLIIFSTSLDSAEEIKKAFISKLEVLYGEIKNKNIESLKISKNANHLNLIEKVRNKYPDSDIRIISDGFISKKAGNQISEAVKDEARKTISILEHASNLITNSKNNISKNLSEYEKIRDNIEGIKSTKGQYHESSKNNVKLAAQYISSIRDCINILNKIKDATTTMEIIEGLASVTFKCSNNIEEIFSLIDKMEGPDFVMLLTEKTNNYIKTSDDLLAAITRTKNYINKNILGIIVLSY